MLRVSTVGNESHVRAILSLDIIDERIAISIGKTRQNLSEERESVDWGVELVEKRIAKECSGASLAAELKKLASDPGFYNLVRSRSRSVESNRSMSTFLSAIEKAAFDLTGHE